MADNKTGFSHIVVGGGSFDDDDEVIVAGIPRGAEPEEPAVEPAPEPEPVVEPAPEPIVEPEPEPEPEPAPAPKPAKKAKKDDYHETTLEDLESTKMNPMQMVLIAAAVVLVIVGIAYMVMH